MGYFKSRAKNLFPGYFALVMATGALSIGSHLLGLDLVSKVLAMVNFFAYVYLWFLTIIRVVYYFPDVKKDITSHALGPGFFTLVAGTCVFGSELLIVLDFQKLPLYLWFLGIILWVIIMYTFFVAVTVRKDKPRMADGINGAWLIAAVATQSVSILGTLLVPYVNDGRGIIMFFTLCMYFLGCMLYLNIITLIFYRFTFVDFKYESLTPPYWINMGAVAITTLAGSTLILHREYWELVKEITPFLKGFTLFFWITGTWWIPLLFILMIWRYVYHHDRFSYDPQNWGMVFPLAMYTTSTFQLSEALEVPFLKVVPEVMVFIAIGAWVAGIYGLVSHVIRTRKGYKLE